VTLALVGVCLSGPSRSATALPTTESAGGTTAAAQCKVVFDASDKLLTTPHHQYLTHVGPMTHGKPRQSELIFAGGAFYVFSSGRWRKSPMTVRDRQEQEQENRKNARNESCRYLGDQGVDGQAAAMYTAHAESDVGTSDTKVWIAKGTGRILKQEESVGEGGSTQAERFSIRFEYDDVRAPKM
jgi:hypothetical protein